MEGKEIGREDDQELLRLVVDTICLLTASLCRNETEFDEWGLEFIKLVQQALPRYTSASAESTVNKDRFFFCVGQGIPLVLQHDEDNDYLLVDEVTEIIKLNSIPIGDDSIQHVLEVYINNFVERVIRSKSFDARAMQICRNFCELFNLSVNDLRLTITEHNVEYGVSKSSAADSTSLAFCSQNLTQQQRQAALLSHRLWRVGAAAATGGALLAISAQVAAPQLVANLVMLLGASNPMGQFVITVSSMISFYGGSGLGIVSSLGAFVAGSKMLNRTAAIQEFCLEPLHNPTMSQDQGSGILGGSGTIIVHSSSTSDNSQECGLDAMYDARSTVTPYYILIPGQVELGIVNERVIWGADGISNVDFDISSVTVTEVRSEFAGGVDSGGAGEPEEGCSRPEISEKINESISSESDHLKRTRLQEISHLAHDVAVVTADLCSLAQTTSMMVDISSVSQNIEAAVHNTVVLTTDMKSVIDDVASIMGSHESTVDDQKDHSESSPEGYPVDIKVQEDWAWEALVMTEKGWWRQLFPTGDAFLLMWARDEVAAFTRCCQNFMSDQVAKLIMDKAIQMSPMQAVSWPTMVLEHATDLDNPWLVTTDRARQAGQLLAATLLQRLCKSGLLTADSGLAPVAEASPLPTESYRFSTSTFDNATQQSSTDSRNQRPVTLIGYGMGSRVVFECLLELARISESEPRATAIVDNVVMMGAPVGFGPGFASGICCALHGHGPEWQASRSVVSGRFINCFSTRDWILSFLYRQKFWDVGVAGLQPVFINGKANTFMLSDYMHQSIQSSEPENVARRCFSKHIQSRIRDVSLRKEVENVDVSTLVRSMLDYPQAVRQILTTLNLGRGINIE